VKKLRVWLGLNQITLLLAGLATILFLYNYISNSVRPGAYPDLARSWHGWFDQGEYLKEARAIHHISGDRSQYTYPLGYPALAAVFSGWLVNDPFLPVNLAVFVFTVTSFYLVARALLGKITAVFLTLALMMATPLLYYTVIPWTTTATLPLVMYLLLLGFVKSQLSYWDGVWLGGFGLLAYTARGGGELLLLMPLALAVIWRHRHSQLLAKLVLAGGIFMIGALANALVIKHLFGSYLQPYVRAVADVGFSLRRVPASLWGTLIFSGRTGDYWPPLILSSPWLLGGLWGSYLAVMRKDEPRIVHLGLITSMLFGLIVTLSFANNNAATLKFNSLHYLKIWFPVLALYAGLAVNWLVGRLSDSPKTS
jgi:hypothetical protein